MSKIVQSLFAALTLTLFSLGAVAQSENPFLGTWDIDIDESDSYSGEQYPIASLATIPTARISYKRINETTVEYTVRLDGEVQQIGAKFISPNYQRLTIAIQYPNSDQKDQILVFNKR